MKAAIGILVLLLSAVPAFAQSASQSQAASAAPRVAVLSSRMPIRTLMANPAARAVVLKMFPHIDKNPAYGALKSSSFQQIAAEYPGSFTEEQLSRLDAALHAIK